MSRSLKYILAFLFTLVVLAGVVYLIWDFAGGQDFSNTERSLSHRWEVAKGKDPITAGFSAEVKELTELEEKLETELREVAEGTRDAWKFSKDPKGKLREIERGYRNIRDDAAGDNRTLRSFARGRDEDEMPPEMRALSKERDALEERIEALIEKVDEARRPPPTGVSEAYMKEATRKLADAAKVTLLEYQKTMPAFEAWAAKQRVSIPKDKTTSKAFDKLFSEQELYKTLIAQAESYQAIYDEYPLYNKELEHRGAEALSEPFASEDKKCTKYVERFVEISLELTALARENDPK